MHLMNFESNSRYENVTYPFGRWVRDKTDLERADKDGFVIVTNNTEFLQYRPKRSVNFFKSNGLFRYGDLEDHAVRMCFRTLSRSLIFLCKR